MNEYLESWRKVDKLQMFLGNSTSYTVLFPAFGQRLKQVKSVEVASRKLTMQYDIEDDRYIVLSAKMNRRSTDGQMASQFSPTTGTEIFRKTLAMFLRQMGLYGWKFFVCVSHLRVHRSPGLQCFRPHRQWTEDDWNIVLFTDSSRFTLSSNSRRQLI